VQKKKASGLATVKKASMQRKASNASKSTTKAGMFRKKKKKLSRSIELITTTLIEKVAQF
jgi:hypothetical protein